jgi:predicted RNA-binding Zn ribbon-like protein
MGLRPETGENPELCLDFTDTVNWRTSDHASDGIEDYGRLLQWSRMKGLIEPSNVQRLSELVKGDAKLRKQVMNDARRLREAIYRVFSASAHMKKADQSDIDVLNGYVQKGLSKMRLQNMDGGYKWTWPEWPEDESAEMMLYPIALSAADLLTSEDLARVKECANEGQGCGSLFLDCSKNQTRKWCSMDPCGNRMKVRAYYSRHSTAKSP